MKQLGITKLRPGPSGNPTADNAANYDEALANPYPDWPAVNHGLLGGSLAWRQHDGGHTDAPNMPHFIQWAEAHFTD